MQSQLDKTAAEPAGRYEQDFFEWTRRRAELPRAGRFERADIEHIAEEIRVQVLVAHLLKRQSQPAKQSLSWSGTIITQRIEIAQTGPRQGQFPAECPLTADQILDPEFLP